MEKKTCIPFSLRGQKSGSSRCSVNVTKNKMHQGYFGPLVNNTTQAHVVKIFTALHQNIVSNQRNAAVSQSLYLLGRVQEEPFEGKDTVFCKYSALPSGGLQRQYCSAKEKRERQNIWKSEEERQQNWSLRKSQSTSQVQDNSAIRS